MEPIVGPGFLNQVENGQSIAERISRLFCLDQKFPDLVLVKKISKAMEELTENENLKDVALSNMPDIDDEIENPYQDSAQTQNRLNTISEEGKTTSQQFVTGDQVSKDVKSFKKFDDIESEEES